MTLFWWSSSVPDGDFLIITQEKFSKTKVSGLQDTKLGHRNSDYMFGDVITRPKSPRDAKNVKMVINLQSRRI